MQKRCMLRTANKVGIPTEQEFSYCERNFHRNRSLSSAAAAALYPGRNFQNSCRDLACHHFTTLTRD